ncbi:hypothetical protein [Actinomadura logoneensis]|uniref:hypothetical protein n=1 Tax=Actinomadura logoneensis TaxID=2293572 RepID=UPI0011C14D4E|nr:hypothetical protein [Actinomadura logoneensis]
MLWVRAAVEAFKRAAGDSPLWWFENPAGRFGMAVKGRGTTAAPFGGEVLATGPPNLRTVDPQKAAYAAW